MSLRNLKIYILFLCVSYSTVCFSFTLITSLYNEPNKQRCKEYITCLEQNLVHPLISDIHVVYDDSRDDEHNYLFEFLKSKSISITTIHGRPSYEICFLIANTLYPQKNIILANGDIFFNETLENLKAYDLTNKFLVLTRWDVLEDGKLEIFKQYKPDGSFNDTGSYLSHDAWIFKTPFRKIEGAHFRLGTWACDSYIAYQALLAGLEVVNPCLSVQACHIHLSGLRTWVAQSIPGQKGLVVPWRGLE